MDAPQAPQAPAARQQPDQPAAAPDAQPGLLPEGAEAGVPAAPKPTPQQPPVTAEDMSGWAMGGSD